MTGPLAWGGRAGCLRIRRARSTGLEVGVYRAAEAGIDAGETWVVVCEAHGEILEVATRHLAITTASTPEDWCETCREHLRIALAPRQ